MRWLLTAHRACGAGDDLSKINKHAKGALATSYDAGGGMEEGQGLAPPVHSRLGGALPMGLGRFEVRAHRSAVCVGLQTGWWSQCSCQPTARHTDLWAAYRLSSTATTQIPGELMLARRPGDGPCR